MWLNFGMVFESFASAIFNNFNVQKKADRITLKPVVRRENKKTAEINGHKLKYWQIFKDMMHVKTTKKRRITSFNVNTKYSVCDHI